MSVGESASRETVGNAVCQTCGARAQRLAQAFCAYCGDELPRRVSPVPVPAQAPPASYAGPFGDLPARFEALGAHPAFEAAQSHQPSSVGVVASHAGAAVFGVVFTIVAVFLFFSFGSAGAPGIMRLVPALFVVFGVGMVVKSISQGAGIASSPLVREPNVVIGKRMQVRGGKNSTSTHYFVTLEGPDARRVESRVSPTLYGLVRAGDMGVSFRRGSALLEFEQVPV